MVQSRSWFFYGYKSKRCYEPLYLSRAMLMLFLKGIHTLSQWQRTKAVFFQPFPFLFWSCTVPFLIAWVGSIVWALFSSFFFFLSILEVSRLPVQVLVHSRYSVQKEVFAYTVNKVSILWWSCDTSTHSPPTGFPPPMTWPSHWCWCPRSHHVEKARTHLRYSVFRLGQWYGIESVQLWADWLSNPGKIPIPLATLGTGK